MSQMSSSLKPWLGELGKIRLRHLLASLAHLHGEVEHGPLPRRDVGLAVVDGDLVGDQRILGPDAQDRAMRDHAVLALVGGARWPPRSSRARPWSVRCPFPSARRDRRRRREIRPDGTPASGRRSARSRISPAPRECGCGYPPAACRGRAAEIGLGAGLFMKGFRLRPRGGVAGTIIVLRRSGYRLARRNHASLAAASAAASSAARTGRDRGPSRAAASALPPAS